MSMLVEISEEPRMHNGRIIKIGQCVKLPNSMALAMIKKGMAVKPSPVQQKVAAETRSKAKSDGKAARAQKKRSAK